MKERKFSVTHLNARNLAARWGVSPNTLRVWVWQGKIPPGFKVAGSSHRLWTLEEIEAHEAEMKAAAMKDFNLKQRKVSL